MVVNTISLQKLKSTLQIYKHILKQMNQINPSPSMFYENGMMNFNYFQNYMADDMKNLFYMQILQ